MQKPSVGRIVLYVLSDQDCRVINSRIEKQELRGNRVSPGEIYPLLICRVWPQELYGTESINGQVMLDGEGSHWLTSCHPHTEKAPGTWHWPDVVKPGGDTISRMNAAMTKEQAMLEKLEERMSTLCQLVEMAGASPGLTTVSVQASNARMVIACMAQGQALPPYLETWMEGARS